MDYTNIIIRPILSEKISKLSEISKQYAFQVSIFRFVSNGFVGSNPALKLGTQEIFPVNPYRATRT